MGDLMTIKMDIRNSRTWIWSNYFWSNL